MDVKPLYTNIPNREDTEAVKEKLNAQSDKPIATKVNIKFLFLILTFNDFIFSCINYLQIKICTIGTLCQPPYANIFIGKLSLNRHIYMCASYTKQ